MKNKKMDFILKIFEDEGMEIWKNERQNSQSLGNEKFKNGYFLKDFWKKQ